jgi:hypothetical protein
MRYRHDHWRPIEFLFRGVWRVRFVTTGGLAQSVAQTAAFTGLGPSQAWREFQAYLLAGENLETLLVSFPRLANWAADHLA